jgi:hypothetical protein
MAAFVIVRRRSDGKRFSELLDEFERITGVPREPSTEGPPEDVRSYYFNSVDYRSAGESMMNQLSRLDPQYDQHIQFEVGPR